MSTQSPNNYIKNESRAVYLQLEEDPSSSIHLCRYFILPFRRAVVSGQSITGMVAAAILANSGYLVDVYEIRADYTRNIQWAGRQSLVNELSSIDHRLSEMFLQTVAGTVDRGSIHFKLDGTRRQSFHGNLQQANPSFIPSNAADMMAHPSVMNMEAKHFEHLLKEYLDTLPPIRRHRGEIELMKSDEENTYIVSELDLAPELIVIAEGGNSSSRQTLGISSIPITSKRLQIAGVVMVESGGVMIKHWRQENGQTLITGLMGKKGAQKTWIVADIDESKIMESSDELKRLAAICLELPPEEVKNLKIDGAIEGHPICPFHLQQHISEKACVGENIILFGDAVGNGHWSVGGGMQVGAVCHAERLKNLIFSIEKGDKKSGLQQYAMGVQKDTLTWGDVGIGDFYPDANLEEIKIAYKQKIKNIFPEI